jgi:hypothetical protein
VRDIVFQAPPAARLLNLGLGIAMIIILTLSIGGGLHPHLTLGLVVAITVSVGLVFCVYRMITLSFRASGQDLVLHNWWRTRRVPVSEIRGISIGTQKGGRTTVLVHTGQEQLPIQILTLQGGQSRPTKTLALEKLMQQRDEIELWLVEAGAISLTTGYQPDGTFS